EPLPVRRADHHGRDADAAAVAVHHDRPAGRGVDDRAGCAGILRVPQLDLEIALAAFDQHYRAVDPVDAAERLARVADAAAHSGRDAVVGEHEHAFDRAV